MQLAHSLLAGKTLEEHAEVEGVKFSTVRTHLKALFSKTDNKHRQAEWVALFNRDRGCGMKKTN